MAAVITKMLSKKSNYGEFIYHSILINKMIIYMVSKIT